MTTLRGLFGRLYSRVAAAGLGGRRLAVVLAALMLSPVIAVTQTLPVADATFTGTSCTLSDGSTFSYNLADGNRIVGNFSGPAFGGTGSIDVTFGINGDLYTINGTQVFNGTTTAINCTINLTTGELVSGACGQFFDTAVLNENAPAEIVASSIQSTTVGIMRDQVRSTTTMISSRLRTVVGQYVRGRMGQTADAPHGRGATGLAAGDMGNRMGVWADGSVTLLDNDRIQVQSDGKTEVALIGVDYRVRDDVIVGLSTGYQGAQLDVGTIRGKRHSNGYVITPYASWIFADNMSLDASVSYGGSSTDIESRLTGSLVTGDFDSRRVTATANWNIYHPWQSWFFTGFAGYSHSWEFQDDYTDSAGAAVNNSTVRYGVVRFGGEAAYKIGAFEPFANMVARHGGTRPADGANHPLWVQRWD